MKYVEMDMTSIYPWFAPTVPYPTAQPKFLLTRIFLHLHHAEKFKYATLLKLYQSRSLFLVLIFL